jgi:hypothetical protein
MSAFASFVNQLLESGQVHVPSNGQIAPRERTAMANTLREFESAWRKEMPGDAPPLDADAAVWGAEKLFAACRLLTYRELGPEAIAQEFSATMSLPGDTPAAHYAVDLTARFLPDVVRLARAASEDDPLVLALLAWGGDWPLSSVGIRGVEPRRLASILAEPSLLSLYVDRILLTGDASRLAKPAVRTAVATAVGAHAELAGSLRATLFPPNQDQAPHERH